MLAPKNLPMVKNLLQHGLCSLLVLDKQHWYVNPDICPFLEDNKPALTVLDAYKGNLHDIDAVVQALSKVTELSASEKALQAVEHMEHLILTARKNSVPVIWTQSTEGQSRQENMNFHLQVTESEDFVLKTEDAAYGFYGLGPAYGETIVKKDFPDGFSSADMQPVLTSLGTQAKTLVVIGAYSARCVLATAFSAAAKGYHVVVPHECLMAHPRYPEEHQAMLDVVDTLLGYVVDKEIVVQQWNS